MTGSKIPLLLVTLAAVVAGLPTAAQQPAPFTSRTELVVVPAVVVDRRGGTVSDLTQDDFTLFEDGKPVPIQTFVPPNITPAGEARFIVLVLDNLRTRAELGFRVRNIAMKFVDRMGPADVMTVIALNGGRATSTSGKAAMRAAIERFRPAFGDSIRTAAQDADTGLQTIGQLTQQMSKAAHRRKVLVFIGAATIFSPLEPSSLEEYGVGPGIGAHWVEAIRETGRNNVSVYAIDAEGQDGTIDDFSGSFTEATGGDAIVNTNNFDRAVERIWRESGSYYLIGYPAPINDRRIHRIEVKVTRPGLTVRARKARG